MADKKKFEKPQMEVIKLNSKVGLLAGSCDTDCGSNCWGVGCLAHD